MQTPSPPMQPRIDIQPPSCDPAGTLEVARHHSLLHRSIRPARMTGSLEFSDNRLRKSPCLRRSTEIAGKFNCWIAVSHAAERREDGKCGSRMLCGMENCRPRANRCPRFNDSASALAALTSESSGQIPSCLAIDGTVRRRSRCNLEKPLTNNDRTWSIAQWCIRTSAPGDDQLPAITTSRAPAWPSSKACAILLKVA